MNYEIIALSSNSETLCSNLRPAGWKWQRERKFQTYLSIKKYPHCLYEMAIKKEIKKEKNPYLLCLVIHLQGNRKHYWDDKENRALERRNKKVCLVYSRKQTWRGNAFGV